jgi:hypothetical protein
MTSLSRAAQTILDAYGDFEAADTDAMAAALRAAATQLHHDSKQSHQIGGIIASRLQLLAIAAELDNINYSTGKGDSE